MSPSSAAPLQFHNPFVAQVLNLTQQLRAYEYLPAAEQAALQQQQLHSLLLHAHQYSPFWRQRLTVCGFDPRRVVPGFLQRLPILSRQDVQESFEALRARWPGLDDAGVSVTTTSGSTGQPVRVERANEIYTPLYEALLWNEVLWHGRDPTRKVAVLGAGLKDREQAAWGQFYALSGWHGACVVRKLDDRPMMSHLAWLVEQRPDYLKCSPFVASELAQLALNNGITLPLRQITSQSERVAPSQRRICQAAFGAKIVDRYSCEETGLIAIQCPEHDHLHVLNATVLLEIVGDDGRPCAPGQVGRVLLTSLYSFAMPIIRYDLGDLAEWGEPCPCGKTLPVIKRLWGRQRHQALLPTGALLPMPFLGDDLGKVQALREFKITQYQGGELDLQVKTSRPLTKAEHDELRGYFNSNALQGLPLFIREVDEIDWGLGWKREEFTRLDTAMPVAKTATDTP